MKLTKLAEAGVIETQAFYCTFGLANQDLTSRLLTSISTDYFHKPSVHTIYIISHHYQALRTSYNDKRHFLYNHYMDSVYPLLYYDKGTLHYSFQPSSRPHLLLYH